MTIRQHIVRCHRWLIPPETELGWTPYLWLIYLGFLYFPFFFGKPDSLTLAITIAAVCLFLPLYFIGFRCEGRQMSLVVATMLALGMVVAPFNSGASVFFVFAASFAAFVGPPRAAVVHIGLVLLAAGAAFLLFELTLSFLAVTQIVSVMVGGSNVFWRQMHIKNAQLRSSQEEIRRLAATAERERIARDLHDLLGHTLLSITLKSDLAGRLVNSDPQRARREIGDVENISRTALAEVRQAVSGYRASTVRGELGRALEALSAAGVELQQQIPDDFRLSTEYQNILGLVIREAVTNIIRHAGAGRCRIVLEQGRQRISLIIEDDGTGGQPRPGSGLRGMRERLESVGGSLQLLSDGRRGLRLVAAIPVPSAEAEIEDQPVARLA